jgi:hypothetical protein
MATTTATIHRQAEGADVADLLEDGAGGRAADRRGAEEGQHRQAQP